MSDRVVVQEEEGTGYRFSWGLALAGAVVAAAVTLFLLTLGSGIGLLLVNPAESANRTPPAFLTGGAIYFFVAQAFGFAAGGHVAGRLLGPLAESHVQQEIRAAIHGLVVWAVAVIGTLVMIAVAGATTAALYGVIKSPTQPEHASAVIVDRLFRPDRSPPPTPNAAQVTPMRTEDGTQARAEAGRLLDAAFAPGGSLSADDRTRLAELTAQQAGLTQRQAMTRVAETEGLMKERMRRTAEAARKLGSYVSLWFAFSLLFGALVAMVAAVTARLEDNRDTPWSLTAFRRGWRS